MKLTPIAEVPGVITGVISAPGQENLLYIIRQGGQIIEYDLNTEQGRIFFDISSEIQKLKEARPMPPNSKFPDERGLLNLVFHPEYDRPGSLFRGVFIVMWSSIDNPEMYNLKFRKQVPDPNHMTCLTQFRAGASLQETMGTGQMILCLPQPEANHNGGGMVFGPDGYLWIGLGDGGGANDEHGPLLDPQDPSSFLGMAQDRGTLHGKILRIEIVQPMQQKASYIVPSSNPFVKNPQYLPEIVALGIRNPWRMSFDDSGRLFIGDVGQNRFEMVKVIPSMTELGGNYGWRGYEGFEVFNQTVANIIGKEYKKIEMPILAYPREVGSAIVGPALDEATGILVIADYGGNILTATETDGQWEYQVELNTKLMNTSLNRVLDGQIYVSTFNRENGKGQVWRVLPKFGLSEADKKKIIQQAVRAAEETKSGFRVDSLGQPVSCRMHVALIGRGDKEAQLVYSMEDAWQGSIDISKAKAFTAMAFSSNQNALTSRTIGVLSQPGQPLWQIGNSNTEAGIIEFAGSAPLYKKGKLVGAIGVSGDGVDQDETVARMGAVGFEAPNNIRSDRVFGAAYYSSLAPKLGETPIRSSPRRRSSR